MKTKPFFLSPALLLLSTTLLTSPALAKNKEVSAENKAAARELAIDGIKLAKEGKCEEAVPQLQRAEKLYHAPTILTWVGECQIQLGRYVQGTENLRKVVREELDSDSPAAFVAAQEKASKLIEETKAKIGRLTIDVVGPDGELDEEVALQVTVDEQPVSEAMIGAPRPTDPGEHTVVVSAPGYLTASSTVTLEEGQRQSVSLTLEIDPNASTEPTGESAAPSDVGSGKTRKIAAWATVGVGGAFLAAGGVTGILAMGKKKDIDCVDNSACDPSQEDTIKAARTNATLSTVFFGVGGAAVVTGVVLLMTGKSQANNSAYLVETPHLSLRPEVGLSSLGLSGRF